MILELCNWFYAALGLILPPADQFLPPAIARGTISAARHRPRTNFCRPPSPVARPPVCINWRNIYEDTKRKWEFSFLVADWLRVSVFSFWRTIFVLYFRSDEQFLFCIFVGTKMQKLSTNQRLGNLIPIFVPTNNLYNFVSFWFVSIPHTDG